MANLNSTAKQRQFDQSLQQAKLVHKKQRYFNVYCKLYYMYINQRFSSIRFRYIM